MNTHEHIPHVSLNFNDLSVLKNIIRSHLTFLRKGMPPSKTREVQIQTLQRLQQRLTMIVNAHTETACILLTVEEIQALDEAFRCFIILIRQMVPASADRDGTLLAVEGLQQQLAGMIAPPSC